MNRARVTVALAVAAGLTVSQPVSASAAAVVSPTPVALTSGLGAYQNRIQILGGSPSGIAYTSTARRASNTNGATTLLVKRPEGKPVALDSDITLDSSMAGSMLTSSVFSDAVDYANVTTGATGQGALDQGQTYLGAAPAGWLVAQDSSTMTTLSEPGDGATPDPGASDDPGTPDPSASDDPGTPDPSASDDPGTPDPGASDDPGTPDPSASDDPGTPDPGTPDPGPTGVIDISAVNALTGVATDLVTLDDLDLSGLPPVATG
ncbi:MAG: hypothetical protein JWO79_3357, partial [Actinomycetia bacterium]|nr:hypothetical protein [Actinomycetes bacterium]